MWRHFSFSYICESCGNRRTEGKFSAGLSKFIKNGEPVAYDIVDALATLQQDVNLVVR